LRLALRADARRRAAALAGADAQELRHPLFVAAHAANASRRGTRGRRRERFRDVRDRRARRRLCVSESARRPLPLPPLMRILFTLQYLGTRYAGWQTQTNAVGVQQVVEAALTKLFGAPVRIEGAGRTDAGVHARAQRAHADVPFEIPTRGLILGANDLLPHDIRVVEAERVADDFHCRFAAKSKTYRYQIWNAPIADVFAFVTHAHVAQALDVARMQSAARALIG